MEKQDLYNKLIDYSHLDYVPMHMPGAKRNVNMAYMVNPYEIDITEIDGFDNMHHANGVIKEGFRQAAHLFGADKSYYLVNGSTAGILTAICGSTKKSDKILVARNCHKSVYNGILLNELNPIYIYPDMYNDNAGICGAIKLSDIREMLIENPDVKAVFITSPTYEGIVCNIKEIAEEVHRYNIPLIVDAAHGAHFQFHDRFPQSAQTQGADIVITSLHKTLPALTPTALLLINGNIADIEKIEMYYHIFQTTSPSYVLMASISQCLNFLEKSQDAYKKYVDNLCSLRKSLTKLKNIKLISVDDISKIVLAANDGKRLYDLLLSKYHIQLEMASLRYVIAMTSVCDKSEYYRALEDALFELDKEFLDDKSLHVDNFCKANVAMSISDALANENYVSVPIYEAEGKIANSCISIYPPGVPIINYGELFTHEIIDTIVNASKKGLEIDGSEFDEKVGILVRCLR